jgi:hypothetical protein
MYTAIFCCSQQTVSIGINLKIPVETKPKRKVGAKQKLDDNQVNELYQWIQNEEHEGRPVTRESAVEFAQLLLHNSGSTVLLSDSYIDSVLRYEGCPVEMVTAIPLEDNRYDVDQRQIQEWARIVEQAHIENIHPDLIINIDETGFNALDARDTKTKKVLASKHSKRPVHYRVERAQNHVSAICGISASGRLFTPGLVHKNKTLNSDAGQCTFFSRTKVYSSDSAFVGRPIYEDYLQNVIIPGIQYIRQSLPGNMHTAMIIVDGYKAHLSDEILAVLALADIKYLFIPPHSSHILQPLDRLFFSRVKAAYRHRTRKGTLCGDSWYLEKVYSSIMSAAVPSIIIASFKRAGFSPMLEGGNVVSVINNISSLTPECLKQPVSDSDDETPAIGSNGQNRIFRFRLKTPSFGMMNASQLKLKEEGKCPMCGKSMV